MSIYTPAETYHPTVTVADDGDPAMASTVEASVESALDNAAWVRGQLRKPRLITFASVGYCESSAGAFVRDFNLMNVYTSVKGKTMRVQLPDLVDGNTLDGVTMIFVPKDTGRGGLLPNTNLSITVSRTAMAAAGTPAAPTVLGTASYTPVSYPNYIDTKYKAVTLSGLAHTLTPLTHVYYLDVNDEDGANAVANNAYVAFAINYGA